MLTMAVSLGLVIVFQNVFEKPVAPVPAPQPGQASSSGAPAVVAPGQPAPAPGTVAPAPGAVAEEPPQPEQVVRLEGAKLKLGLSTLGGRVVDAQLPDFVEHDGKSKKRGDFVDVVSLKGDLGGDLRLSFAGLSPTASYRIKEQTEQSVTFEREGGGWRITRRYRFDPAGFGLRHDVELTNLTAAPLTIEPAMEMTGRVAADERDRGGFMSMDMPTDQTTLVCETPKDLFREPAVNLTDKEVKPSPGPVFWSGVDRQYFLAGYVPRGDAPATTACVIVVEGERASQSVHYAATTVAPGQTVTLGSDAFFGPKQKQHLESVDPRLDNAIDYGWFGVLVRLLLGLLLWFYKLVPNYGVCIFLLTLTVKLVTLPLSQKQYVSMQHMKDIQPQVKEMQEKYAHDKAMQGQKLMELYKKHNVNPAGGCLPMLIQMPIWIALYRTLYTSVELYQQPFVKGWIGDLTQMDPFYITPIVLGGVMLIQAFMTPQPQDNPQMKYMQYGMPVFFTFLMAGLPSGLTLYMVFNAVLTIFQQLYIKRRFGAPEGTKKA